MKSVLLLVDFQNDFLRVGDLEPHPAGIVAAAANLLNGCRNNAVPIIHVWSTVSKSGDNRMPHRKKNDDWMCLENSAGHACPDSLRPHKKEVIIQKIFFSAFSTNQLDLVLQELKADVLIIAGVHLHACVRATALDAYAKGYGVVVVEDSVASNDPVHATITKRYLQNRSVIFRSSAELASAIAEGTAKLEELLADEESEVVTHSSPQNCERRWRLAAGKQSDVDAAIAAARKVFQDWRRVRVDERLRLLQAFGCQLQKHEAELIDLLVDDIGKPIRYARDEVARAIALIDAAAAQVEPGQDRKPEETGYRREPLGVIGLIAPFNNPLAIPIGKIVPAILYGNVVIWKPAIPGSRIAQKASELFAAATDRPELLQVLCGGEETARKLMARSDAVTISGSSKAGRAAQEICAAHYIPLQAELGGNNASIVWRDADLAAAATSIAEGAFVFAGQRCTANRRAIIDSGIYDIFLNHLVLTSRRRVWGDPADEKTQIGPLISSASRNRVKAVIDRARAAAFRVISPSGRSDGARGDAWLEPTIVCCDDPSAEIVQEETFGPVLVVQRADDWDEAISLCNHVKQGLAAAIFSTSPDRIEDFLQRVRAGILKINCSTADAAVDLPFGGWKASGIGPAEHGPANREFFTRMQSIYLA
jgi:acyl-CoA reductase-like NAD-dependent aldehyde dehydrogenase/nicotinamidase-related amidase